MPNYRFAPEDWTSFKSIEYLIEAWYGTVYDLAKSLEFSTSGVEYFVFASEFLDEWYLKNYFQSGYFYGSGIANILFMVFDFQDVYVDNLRYQMSDYH